MKRIDIVAVERAAEGEAVLIRSARRGPSESIAVSSSSTEAYRR